MNDRPKPPFPKQQQPMPGLTAKMQPVPDHGENTYKGSGRLTGKKALITGADSGIGRAVAIAYAREGADILISYLCEDEDAAETKRWVEKAGRKALLVRGDIQRADHCRNLVDKAIEELGGIDILVNHRFGPEENSEVLNSDEVLSVMQALRVYTYNGAYTAFEEDEKGSLEEGKLADMAVLSDDILSVSATKIREIKIDQTYVDGRLVFDRAN